MGAAWCGVECECAGQPDKIVTRWRCRMERPTVQKPLPYPPPRALSAFSDPQFAKMGVCFWPCAVGQLILGVAEFSIFRSCVFFRRFKSTLFLELRRWRRGNGSGLDNGGTEARRGLTPTGRPLARQGRINGRNSWPPRAVARSESAELTPNTLTQAP